MTVALPPELRLGACVDLADPDVMMGTTAANRDIAARLCEGCDVKAICAQYALDLQDSDEERRVIGVWGGRYFFDSGQRHSRLIGPRMNLPGKRTHGKSGYVNGCRCLECSNANAASARKCREKRAAA